MQRAVWSGLRRAVDKKWNGVDWRKLSGPEKQECRVERNED